MAKYLHDDRDNELYKRLLELNRNARPSAEEIAMDDLNAIKHYGIYDEMYDFIMNTDGITGGDVAIESIFAFRRKPDRVVWTEEEFNEKIRTGEVSEYDVFQMADGFVPPQ